MATKHLPDNPDLGQLRSQARELQRDSGVPLYESQLTLARSYGFGSWARLKHHVEAINARTWNYTPPGESDSLVDSFLRAACLNYASDPRGRIDEALTLLVEHPELPSLDIAVAAVCSEPDRVRRFLADDPSLATKPTGPYGWSPLMYLAYGRVDAKSHDTLDVATLLLEAGADPNDGRFFGGSAIPFTVLTGVFGGGEQDQPPHPGARSLGRLLLRHGAEPNDGQTLYNRMFSSSDDPFALLFEFGLGRGEGGVWHRLIPDLLSSPAEMVAGLLHWAVTHDQRDRVALLNANGVDVVGPLPRGKTPLGLALANGNTALAEQLRGYGAVEPTLKPVEAFVAAVLAGDAVAVNSTSPKTLAIAKKKRPGLIVWAASRNRLAGVELLVGLGFDINAFSRGDIPVEQEWQTALHSAVEGNHGAMVARLLELGADPTLRDRRFDGTPLDWAHHLGHQAMADLLKS